MVRILQDVKTKYIPPLTKQKHIVRLLLVWTEGRLALHTMNTEFHTPFERFEKEVIDLLCFLSL